MDYKELTNNIQSDSDSRNAHNWNLKYCWDSPSMKIVTVKFSSFDSVSIKFIKQVPKCSSYTESILNLYIPD